MVLVDSENFTPAPIERILERMPGVTGVVVYAVPDAVTADQVMATIELEEGEAFDPDKFVEFATFQRDLGPKWVPRFIRVTEQIPLTGTGKVDKKPLRAERWVSSDPIWWRPGRDLHYVEFSPADAASLQATFAENGREHLLEAAT
jgi:fatty-acyl-CoA synthase